MAPGWRAPLAILALLTFAALITFRRAHTWPTLLLATFAVMVGIFLRALLPEAVEMWPWALVASAGVPLLGVPLGWRAGTRLRRLIPATWAAAWIYTLGWIAWQLLAGNLEAPFSWGIGGLIVFSLLTVTWSSSLPGRELHEPGGAVASELYLIGLNLGLAALMVARG